MMTPVFTIAVMLSVFAVLPTPAQAKKCIWDEIQLPRRYEISPKSRARACRWSAEVDRAAATHEMDPDLLNALIIVESRWKPWAVSVANACGLTQVIPKWTGGKASNRRKWTCDELKSPRNSIRAGAQILKWWITHRKGDIREGLCGYNAGFRTCKRAGARYARAVLHLQAVLKAARAQTNAPEKNN